MAKHKSYGKKPYAKFFKNKKKVEDKDNIAGIFTNDIIYLDEDLKQYIFNNVETVKDMSMMFNGCKNISTIKLKDMVNQESPE